MTVVPLPAAGYFNTAITNSQAKDAFDAQLAFLRQSVLGVTPESTLTIAAGIVTPTSTSHKIDTEAAAASDDLTNIAVTNMTDGQTILIRGVSAARVVTLKNAAGGSGQISLANAADVVLDSTKKFVILRLNSTTWEEVSRNIGIDASAIGAGTVSNTEFGYLNDVTSAIQTQLNAKSALATPSFTTTIGVGGATAAASGAGISFPATQSASTDPNTLDDYEEGTWTPIMTSDGTPGTHTYNNQNGAYTKIGRSINCFVYMALASKDGAMSGTFAQLGGLPFGARSQTGSRYGAVFTDWGAFTSAMYHSGVQIQTGTKGYLLKQTGATSGQGLCAPADITASTYMGGPFYYEST